MFVLVSFFLWRVPNRSSLLHTLFDFAGSPPIYTQILNDLMAFVRGDVDTVVIVVLKTASCVISNQTWRV